MVLRDCAGSTAVLDQRSTIAPHSDVVAGLATSTLTEQDVSAWQQIGTGGVDAFFEWCW